MEEEEESPNLEVWLLFRWFVGSNGKLREPKRRRKGKDIMGPWSFEGG
jgi:hypothetical protein